MIRCMRSKVNLKSSTYNQTGQSYFEQLEACNLMSWHLRRILLAKSVVDTKNKDYLLKKSRQCKVQGVGRERIYLHPDVIDDVIDRLAYDTQHHPVELINSSDVIVNIFYSMQDILKMTVNPKRLDCCNCCNLDFRQRGRRQRSPSKSCRNTSPTTSRSPKRKKFICKTSSGKDLKCMRDISPTIDPSTGSRQRPESQSLTQETSDHRSVLSSTSRSYDGSVCDAKSFEQFASKRSCQKEEDKKYIKFVYDITKDIMQNGFYTDKELQSVFKKHIDQNKRILNMNRMLYEIYQLKISLNIVDDSEEDEALDDLIHAQKLLSVSEIRPPTPPKVLDENKVMEKLESYQKMIDSEKRFLNGDKKSVTLVDANHELLVTEEDVLLSLMEGGIDPKQAQHICRNLLYRSRDAVVNETAQVDAETCSTDLKVDAPEELRDNDKQISEAETIESTRDSVANNSTSSSVKQETSSYSTSDFISTQAETIETKEDTKSETQTKSISENTEEVGVES
ncbi:hypothetical protein DMN91_007797 [Ooceraea biroi]|uniref:Spermatogenesis-associated protein 7-like protein n=1 Tax=Ooceraea biroi TaxID=2015173 RepID=A0A3L8DFJ9_OOCBI|nr:uncharacterized protein LOC105275574 isoform X2 [Ooceraea biroi]RLU19240.1 hypothetical protein DMN91_007797 [Ooceraea biroi]